MIKTRTKRFTALLVCVLLLLPMIAFAQPQSTPNGPYVEVEQNLSLQGYLSNDELFSTLQKLESRSKGKMQLEIAGYSNAINGDLMEEAGYPLYVAKFGEADPNKTRVLITSQIHGNEPIGTEAVIDLIQTFLSNGKEVQEILKDVTVWFMPRINPDGSETYYNDALYPVRYTHQDWDPEAFGLPADTTAPWYYNLGFERAQANKGRINYGIPGFDQNRDYNPNLDFRIEDFDADVVANFLNNGATNQNLYGGFYVTPEAQIVTKVFQELQPDVYFDLHHRGFNTLSDEDNRSVPIQIAAVVADPYTDPFTGQEYEVDDDVLELAKQINVLGAQSLQRGNSHYGAIQRYPNVNLPGTALGAFALNDASIMLIEIKGQSQTLGQKQSGMLLQATVTPIYEILKRLSNGSVYEIDPALYDEIPISTNRISDPSVR